MIGTLILALIAAILAAVKLGYLAPIETWPWWLVVFPLWIGIACGILYGFFDSGIRSGVDAYRRARK